MTILIYALGGGWGHLTRAAALAQALCPEQVRILSNSPYASKVQAAMPDLEIEQSSSFATDSWPDILVVDTFPRGLLGELADLKTPAKRVLIHRDLAPEYVDWAGDLRQFVATTYDSVLCPGECGPFVDLPQSHSTAPWLIRKPVAAPPSEVLVVAAGYPDELAWYGFSTALLARGGTQVRCVAPELPPDCPRENWIEHWPAIDYIAAARVVIGGAGYNTVHECLATGTPLIARPWPRKYDRQMERARRNGIPVVQTPLEAVEAALRLLDVPPPVRPLFVNGAIEAAEYIRVTIGRR